MHRAAVWIAWVSLCGGCSGGYVLTAPDCLAPAGGEAPVVVRLQHRELPFFTPPAKAVALRFRVAEGSLRAARTDKDGYASATLPAPAATGVYPLTVALQDIEGIEASWELATFVWDPLRPIIAVDLEAVLHRGRGIPDAQPVLTHLAETSNILYLTDKPIARFPKLRQALVAAGLPDGPILPWGSEEWWQWGWWQGWRQGWRELDWWKKEIILSPLVGLREAFPGLEAGIAGSQLGVQAFHQAGMKCALVRRVRGVGDALQPTSWTEMAEGLKEIEGPK